MLKSVHDRALYAFGRIRRRSRLTPHESADYQALLDLASRPHRHHDQWARSAGFDPERVGTVLATKRKALSFSLGMGSTTKTLIARLARFTELGLASDRGAFIVLRPGGVVRLDDHRAAYETDATLADGRPWPVVQLPGRRGPALAGRAAPSSASRPEPRGQIDLRLAGSWGDPSGSPQDPLTVYKKEDDAGGGAPAFTRSTLPDLDEPEGFDVLATLAEDVAQPFPDGRPYRLSRQNRRRLVTIAERHGLDTCRSTLETGGDYRIEHPVGWLDATLEQRSKPAPLPDPDPADELDPLEAELLACIPEVEGRTKRRRLSAKSRELLAALIAAHGDQALRAALPDAADWHWPVQRLQAVLTGDTRKHQARSGPADFSWRQRKAEREARRLAALRIGQRTPLTPEQAAERAREMEAQAQRDTAAQAAHTARLMREVEQAAADRATAEQRTHEAHQRREADRPKVRAKLEQLAAAIGPSRGAAA